MSENGLWRRTYGRSASLSVYTGAASVLMALLLALPLVALLFGAGRGSPPLAALQRSALFDALLLSLRTTAFSMLWILLLGTPLALLLARFRFPGRRLLNVLVDLPIVLPPVVAGLALLLAFGRRGLAGPLLAQLGISLPFTPAAIVVAQVFVAAPFYIRAVQSRFATIPRDMEEAAAIDGADGWQILRHVTFPLSRSALLIGLLLSWTRALGEFGATILFAGNLQGRTQTMPLLVYSVFERDLDAALWAGVILIALAATTLILVQLLTRALDDQRGDVGTVEH